MEVEIAEIDVSDLIEINKLALQIDGNPRLTPAYIKHWYFENPTASYSFWKLTLGQRLIGFATINHYYFWLDGKRILIGMPQNEYIAASYRGKGFFRDLYWRTERTSIDRSKVKFFLTFPNSKSTPIFKHKFGYIQAQAPIIKMSFFNVFDCFSKVVFKTLDHVTFIQNLEYYQFDHALDKSMNYLQWRYALYSKKDLHILEIVNEGTLLGYAFLKPYKKFGLRFLMLLDLIAVDKHYIPFLISQCKTYCSQQLFLGLIRIQIREERSHSLFEMVLKNKLNLMFKTNDSEISCSNNEAKFQFFFGDLDIF